MATIHASLIDYRFRMLPMLQMPQNTPPKSKKKPTGIDEFEELEM